MLLKTGVLCYMSALAPVSLQMNTNATAKKLDAKLLKPTIFTGIHSEFTIHFLKSFFYFCRNVSHNRLVGSIPESFANLQHLINL